MPLSFPKGILYIPLDGVDAFSTNNKTGLPTAIGNMPNIPAMQNGPGNIPVEPTGPFTSFFMDRKTGKATLTLRNDVLGLPSKNQGNYVDELGNYNPPAGSYLASVKDQPYEINVNDDLSQQGNPTNDTLNGRNPNSLPDALDSRQTGVSYKLRSIPSTPTTLIVNKMRIFNAFLDYSGKQFSHGLDYLQGGKSTKDFLSDSSSLTNLPTDIHLGSFITTRIENEDPTYLGYDIVIKTDTSPLFNGELLSFLQRYRNYTELGSRISVYEDFVLQIRRFLNYDEAKVGEVLVTNKGKKNSAPINTYYLKKLSGLKNLVEKTQGDSAKFFPEYPKDKLSLTFREDVTQSIGYLASLYKTLSWSRINGKQIIPENLLRFDCDIIISEVKKYNRIIKEGTSVKTYKDNISKYVYSLYECQFYFDDLPHGDDLDMSNVTTVDDYSIDINYKYSTMKFVKFEFNIDSQTFDSKILNNQLKNVTESRPNDEDVRFNINQQTGELEIEQAPLFPYDTSPNVTFQSGSLDSLRFQNPPQSVPQPRNPIGVASPFINLKRDLRRAFANEINRQISKQVGLLFKTIENLRRQVPFAGQLDEPTNVYSGRSQFENELINAGRNFVGSSLRGLFGNPSVQGNLPRRRGGR